MNSAWISAFSAVMGSLVGAFTSFVTTYANQRAQYRRDFLSKQLAQRETLYSEFTNEAARLTADSLEREMAKPSALVAIYGLENRIRLNASDEVVQAAANVVREIVESYRRPRMTDEEIRRAAYFEMKDPLKGFGEACRKELNQLYHAALTKGPGRHGLSSALVERFAHAEVEARRNEAFCVGHRRDGHPTPRNWSLDDQLCEPCGRPSNQKELATLSKQVLAGEVTLKFLDGLL
jgi:hypothetical protein